ncbi:hypothetical protein VTJ04DRAFT_1332 [Mycothermus thermophilus]|uniref:uncharacterized protein n=1 Tax=Humicola insolens TaxID=85995 RepID=UPI003742C04C
MPDSKPPNKAIKVVIVGAGSVGVTTAYALLLDGLAADIVLIDIDRNRALGEVMDLSHAAHLHKARVRVGDYEDCEGAAAVIITAGVNQKPGQTRMDLVKTNYALFKDVVPRVAKNAPDTIIIVATNPVDVLTHAAYKLSGFPRERVIGSGTAMDTTRFRHELGKHFGVNPRNVHAVIIGEHGDSQLAVWSLATISGMRLKDYCAAAGVEYNEEELEACATRTKEAAYEIIRRKGKTNYGVASVLVSILQPIVADSDAIMTVSRVGSYAGVDDTAVSMPCKLNRHGAYQDVPLLLNDQEREALRKSAQSIRDVISSVEEHFENEEKAKAQSTEEKTGKSPDEGQLSGQKKAEAAVEEQQPEPTEKPEPAEDKTDPVDAVRPKRSRLSSRSPSRWKSRLSPLMNSLHLPRSLSPSKRREVSTSG